MDRLQAAGAAAGEVVSGEPKQSRGFRVIPPFPKKPTHRLGSFGKQERQGAGLLVGVATWWVARPARPWERGKFWVFGAAALVSRQKPPPLHVLPASPPRAAAATAETETPKPGVTA